MKLKEIHLETAPETARGVLTMQRKDGFTLIEMLVVIGIIGILIAALVPTVQKVQIRAKEAAVKTNLASIESGLATYAQNNNGNYPGTAVDPQAPYADHGLGDPALTAAGAHAPGPGWVTNGMIGGFGSRNASSDNVFQQIKNVKDTPLGGAASSVERHFDSLILQDALQEYPSNPFITDVNTNSRARMRNIFYFNANLSDAGFDPNDAATWSDTDLFEFALRVRNTGDSTGVSADPDALDSSSVFLNHLPAVASWTPRGFSDACRFGTDENDYFSPGDFAYVPILTTSTYSYGDSAQTLEDERFKWGNSVTGYLLFGYGDQGHNNNDFEDEKREFVAKGLPGYGSPGVDTVFENAVLQLFEGAIYYSRK